MKVISVETVLVLGFEYSTKVLVLVLEYSCKTEYLYLYSWHHQVIVLGLKYKKMYLNPSMVVTAKNVYCVMSVCGVVVLFCGCERR